MVRLFILLLLAGFCFPSSAEEGLEGYQWKSQVLQPVFRPGKIYRFVSVTDATLAPPGEMPRQVRIEQQARFDTSSRLDGLKGVALLARTERLQVSIQKGENRITFDSIAKEEEQDPVYQHFESTVNRYIKMELDGKMRVQSHAEGGRVGAPSPLPNLPSFGPEELLQLINLISQGYSPEPIYIGEVWYQNGKRLFGELGELDFGITYRLGGVVKHGNAICAAVDFQGHLTGDIHETKGKGINFQGSQISGRILFDPNLKMTRLAEFTVMMHAKIPNKDVPAQVKTVPVYQKISIRLLSVK